MKVHVIPREITRVSVAEIRVNKSDIPKTNAPSMKRFVNVTFSNTHTHTHVPKTITTLVGTIPRHRAPSIYHILSLARSPHSITRRTAMNQRPRWCGASLKAFRQFSFVRDEGAQAKREKERERVSGERPERRDERQEKREHRRQRAASPRTCVHGKVQDGSPPLIFVASFAAKRASNARVFTATLKPLTVAGAAISSLLNRR